ncbi:DUF5302 domain-containing protein [Actinomadura flavalba]|uniref:DUF5302 domain-containing protein n=1 Tax=Actinomadura flavalba TaxID=1120938 RepID=UPI00037BEA87|nr:DUF5302 domain-containing protein [Actinomadura flavalba]
MADSSTDPSTDPSPEGSAPDDVKRRFREALERKRGVTEEKHQQGGARSGSKVRGATDRAAQQRQFRRKSG